MRFVKYIIVVLMVFGGCVTDGDDGEDKPEAKIEVLNVEKDSYSHDDYQAFYFDVDIKNTGDGIAYDIFATVYLYGPGDKVTSASNWVVDYELRVSLKPGEEESVRVGFDNDDENWNPDYESAEIVFEYYTEEIENNFIEDKYSIE